MAVIAQEGTNVRLSSLLKSSDTPEQMKFFSDAITVNETGTPTLSLGTVVGKVTATGKFKVAVDTAVDGSQVPAGIVWANNFGAVTPFTVEAATDYKCLALVRGKLVVSREGLKLDASFNTAAKKLAAENALKALGILVEASN